MAPRNTIYYVAELDRAFSEIFRVLKTSGRAVVGVADPDEMAQRSFTQHGLALRPIAEITDRLRAAQLEVEAHHRVPVGQDTFHLLVAAPAAG